MTDFAAAFPIFRGGAAGATRTYRSKPRAARNAAKADVGEACGLNPDITAKWMKEHTPKLLAAFDGVRRPGCRRRWAFRARRSDGCPLARPRAAHVRARASAYIFPTRDVVFYYGCMANQFEIGHLTPRKRAYSRSSVCGMWRGRSRGCGGHWTIRLGRRWGQSTSDRLAYLQAKFDRRVSDLGSRAAAATLIEEWRQRSMTGLPKLGPDRPVRQFTDGELMAAISERQYGQSTPKADRPPPPPKPARMPRKPSKSRTSKKPPVLPSGANELYSNME